MTNLNARCLVFTSVVNDFQVHSSRSHDGRILVDGNGIWSVSYTLPNTSIVELQGNSYSDLYSKMLRHSIMYAYYFKSVHIKDNFRVEAIPQKTALSSLQSRLDNVEIKLENMDRKLNKIVDMLSDR